MKACFLMFLLLLSTNAIAECNDCKSDSEYWKTSSKEEVADANKKISESLIKAKALLKADKPDYNSSSSYIADVKSLCYAMACKANKGFCLEAFELSGAIEYLKADGIPTLNEIEKNFPKR